jgi:hypothetical protein
MNRGFSQQYWKIYGLPKLHVRKIITAKIQGKIVTMTFNIDKNPSRKPSSHFKFSRCFIILKKPQTKKHVPYEYTFHKNSVAKFQSLIFFQATFKMT